MSKLKGDIEIGRRMWDEVNRLFPNITNATRQFGCSRNVVYGWANGTTPGGLYLARLHAFGGDVLYVLTGKRSVNDGQ